MFRPLILTGLLLGALPAAAQEDAGAYLAGRAAQMGDDFVASARYLSQAMARDPENLPLMEALAGAYLSLEEVDKAAAVAGEMLEAGGESQVGALAILSDRAAAGDWEGVLARLDDGVGVGPLYDGLVRGWALLGAGRTEAALAAFDAVGTDGSVAAYGAYHKALALAALGRFEEAENLLAGEEGLRLTRRGLRARTEILSQLGRAEAASDLLAGSEAGTLDAALAGVRERLDAGETLDYTVAPDATAGIAEVSFDIANAVAGQTSPSYALLYARMAEYLRPDHTEATLLSAILFEEMEQYDLAVESYDRVPADDPAYLAARLGRAEAQMSAGRKGQAIETMQRLAGEYPDRAVVHVSLGDSLREEDRFAEARDAYDEAIALFEGPQESQWKVYFARAITEERLDAWEAAEADFRQALELSPEQPQVLNYLGYSLLERHEKLDEALSMIETAVDASPDSGYIVDSLGWGLYRLGRYEEAVEPMEKAVSLMPVDPVVNDHLGDVLWAVGRELEARFQWQRALSFAENDQNDEVDPERIRRKLEIGLDRVLAEEGSPPLKVADGR